MRTTLMSLTCFLGLFAAVLAVPPGTEPEPVRQIPADYSLEGYYACTGSQGGEAYSGIVVIRRRTGVYQVQYNVGAQVFIGVGHLVHGKAGEKDQFVVGWAAVGGEARGGNLYTVRERGKTLAGTWASLPGDGQPHTEKLEWLRPLGAGKE